MNINIKKLTSLLNDLCTSHTQVNSYYHGDYVEILKSKEITYTTVITTALNAVVNPNDVTVSLQMFVLDKVLKDKANYEEVESNTLAVLGDIVNYIQGNGDEFRYARLSNSPTATKVEERAFDVVDGWQVTLNFKLQKSNGTCFVPIN